MRSNNAFTLMELMLAVAITSIIGLSIAGVSLALSRSYAHTQDFYSNLQTGRTSMSRMQDMLRKTKLVTSAGSDCLVVWTGDQEGTGFGQINRQELVMWIYNSAASEIRQYSIVYPDALLSALNVVQPLSTVLAAPSLTNLVNTDIYSQSTVIATDVRAFRVTLDQAAPMARCVKLEITVGSVSAPVKLESAVRLRADATSKVVIQNSQYVLDTTGL